MARKPWVHGSITYGPLVVEVREETPGSWFARIGLPSAVITTDVAGKTQTEAERLLCDNLKDFLDAVEKWIDTPPLM